MGTKAKGCSDSALGYNRSGSYCYLRRKKRRQLKCHMWINYWPFINNNKKEGILVFFLTHEFTQEPSLAQFKKRESFFCQEINIHHSKNIKIRRKIKKGREVAGSTPPKASEIHSSRSEKQRWWARSRVAAALEAAGLRCHFRSLAAHTHLNTATWTPSSHGGRPGYSGSIPATLCEEGGRPLCRALATPMQDALSHRAAIEMRKNKPKTGCLLPSSTISKLKEIIVSFIITFFQPRQ